MKSLTKGHSQPKEKEMFDEGKYSRKMRGPGEEQTKGGTLGGSGIVGVKRPRQLLRKERLAKKKTSFESPKQSYQKRKVVRLFAKRKNVHRRLMGRERVGLEKRA